MNYKFFMVRSLMALVGAFIVIAGAQYLKSQSAVYALTQGAIWAPITAAIYILVLIRKFRKSPVCFIKDEESKSKQVAKIMKTKNLLQEIPADLKNEVFEVIAASESVKVERIISKGQVSSEWYDQDQHEWVLVLQGSGELLFADGTSVRLGAGDYLNIPAHCKHKVSWTPPDEVTIWLAIFYS